jgi:hypothetical protein
MQISHGMFCGRNLTPRQKLLAGQYPEIDALACKDWLFMRLKRSF